MERCLISAAIIALTTLGAHSNARAACEDDTLESVSDGGEILIMISGEVFQVNPIDQVDTALWLAADDVLICDDIIVNTDENGEKISATRLR
jgi:hypothetical protein